MSENLTLAEIDRQLDTLHEECPPAEGSCWCCCMVCTENEATEELRCRYWMGQAKKMEQ